MVLDVADRVRDRLGRDGGRPRAGGADLGRLCREPFPTRPAGKEGCASVANLALETALFAEASWASSIHLQQRKEVGHELAQNQRDPTPAARQTAILQVAYQCEAR